MDKKKAVVISLGAFCLPVVVMLGIYWARGIYPFGPSYILTIDMNNQYVTFFSYLREILKGEHSFFYTFSKTLGGDMTGLSAYYLLSPLNVVLCFFSTEILPVGIEILTLIKLGLCGLTMNLFLSRKESSWMTVLFSVSYALMSYGIVYQQNLMWLDGVLLLPLVLWGIHKIMEGKPFLLYVFALTGSILTNYYIGFMICIFSAIYFCYLLLAGERQEKVGKTLGKFAGGSVLAAGLSSFLLLPVFFSLQGGKAGFSLDVLSLQKSFHWSDFFLKLFIGSFDYREIQTGLPNVFCGMGVLFLACLFFLVKGISLQKKLAAALVMVVLYLSFYIDGFNLIWHGLNYPAWFPYRYSFVFCAFLILLAREAAGVLQKEPGKRLLLITGVLLALFSGLAYWALHQNATFLTKEKLLLSTGIFAGSGLLWLAYREKKSQKAAGILLALLCLGELFLNGRYCLEEFHYQGTETYAQEVKDPQAAVDLVKEQDYGFYRMEKTFSRGQNDPMLFGYRGLSHYSSTEKDFVKYFMGQTGFRNNGNWSYYNRGSTYAMDALLGVKYVLTKDTLGQGYEKMQEYQGISVYENQYALPIGFLADSGVTKTGIDEEKKLKLQNQIWKALSPETEEELFEPEGAFGIRTVNVIPSEENGETHYRKTDPQKPGYIQYIFTAQNTDPVFAYIPCSQMKKVTAAVNGRYLGAYFDVYQYDIMRLGSFEKGEQVTLTFSLQEEEVFMGEPEFYSQNMDAMQQYYDSLKGGFLRDIQGEDTKITGTVDNDGTRDTMLFTIPSDSSWRVCIDGEETGTETAFDTFLTVKVPKGTHKIELRYQPAGWKGGILTSACSLGILGFCLVYCHRKKRK